MSEIRKKINKSHKNNTQPLDKTINKGIKDFVNSSSYKKIEKKIINMNKKGLFDKFKITKN